jgi:hypothetical protein
MQQAQTEGRSPARALAELQQRQGWYDVNMLAIVRGSVGGADAEAAGGKPNVSVTVADLSIGMVLYSDLKTKDGTLVLTKGHQITQMSLQKIQNFDQLSGVKEPIFVEAPR